MCFAFKYREAGSYTNCIQEPSAFQATDSCAFNHFWQELQKEGGGAKLMMFDAPEQLFKKKKNKALWPFNCSFQHLYFTLFAGQSLLKRSTNIRSKIGND